jgi:hypothetical protein
MHIFFVFFVDSDTNSHNEEVPRLSGNAVVITRGHMGYQVFPKEGYKIGYIFFNRKLLDFMNKST